MESDNERAEKADARAPWLPVSRGTSGKVGERIHVRQRAENCRRSIAKKIERGKLAGARDSFLSGRRVRRTPRRVLHREIATPRAHAERGQGLAHELAYTNVFNCAS